MQETDRSTEVRTIQAGGSISGYWLEVAAQMDLLSILTWRDFSARYKQSLAGPLWAVIRPAFTVLILVFVFRAVAGMDADHLYVLTVASAILPWQVFSTMLQEGSNCLVANSHLITKVYFPRVILLLSSTLLILLDVMIGFLVLIPVISLAGGELSARLLLLPVLFFGIVAIAAGPTLLLAAWNARYRDVRHAVPFLVQLLLYASPVGYSWESLGKPWSVIMLYNPMTPWLALARSIVLGTPFLVPGWSVAFSVGLSAVLLVAGVRSFRRVERVLADLI